MHVSMECNKTEKKRISVSKYMDRCHESGSANHGMLQSVTDSIQSGSKYVCNCETKILK